MHEEERDAMGIGVSWRVFHTRIYVYALVSDSCMSSAGSYTHRRLFVTTRRDDLSRVTHSIVLRLFDNKRQTKKFAHLNIYFRFKCVLLVSLASRASSLCSQVRRATEAIQRLCQCPSEKCSKLKVRKVGEGRYHIAGRNVFIRVRIFLLYITRKK